MPLVGFSLAAGALIVCHVVGVRPGDGILADLPRMPSAEEGSSRLAGEAIVLAVAAASALVPAGLVVAVALFVTSWLRIPEPANDRICVGLGLVAYVAYLAAIVLHPGWGWFVVAGAGPVAAVLVAMLVIFWWQDRRETRERERAREGRVSVWRRRWQAAETHEATEIVAPAAKAPSGPDGSLADEAAAWLSTEGVEGRTSWPLSRPKCAALALVIPIALVFSVWFSVTAGLVELPDVGAGGSEGDQAVAVLVMVGAVFGVLGLIGAWEYGRLAIVGGGFEAHPEGLLFRLGTTKRWFAWTEVGRIAVAKQKSSTVLVIKFPEGGMRWPRSLSLWSSDTSTLYVSSQIFADPVEAIATGIRQAKYRYLGESTQLEETPEASEAS